MTLMRQSEAPKTAGFKPSTSFVLPSAPAKGEANSALKTRLLQDFPADGPLALCRLYEVVGADGYPAEWHDRIKHAVREAAGHRCVRCGHPYSKGDGEWSACDDSCRHQDNGPLRVVSTEGELLASYEAYNGGLDIARAGWNADDAPPCRIEAQWRILTVHHLNGNKADCRWWNLVSLCQRCHLRVQRVVLMERVWPWEHSDWFKPYVAGYYAHAYLGEDLTREQTAARLDELLALELQAGAA